LDSDWDTFSSDKEKEEIKNLCKQTLEWIEAEERKSDQFKEKIDTLKKKIDPISDRNTQKI